MKAQFKSLSFLGLAILTLALGSCQNSLDIENERLENETAEQSAKISSVEFEENLIKLGAAVGIALQNEEAKAELFGFAKIKGNAGDVGYSLKRLFEDQTSPKARKRSAIYSAMVQNQQNLRINQENDGLEDLIAFAKSQDIDIIAPYLARNFDESQISELTISWWTKEMEEAGLAKDPKWPGETPAFKIKFDKSQNLMESILAVLHNGDLEIFYVSDDYAMKNPTIVLGAFDEDLYNLDTTPKPLFLENLSMTNVVPFNVGVKCDQILSGDIIRYNIPEYRILNNTRSWPNGNFISVWVAYGAYNMSGGAPVLNFNINQIAYKWKISRGDFGWKSNWFGPVLSHWDATNYSIQIIFAYEKNNTETTQTVESVSINPTTGVAVSSQKTETFWDHRTYGTQTWYRCQEINGAHKVSVPPTYTTLNGNAIWQMSGEDGGIQFTLEPRLTRF